MTERDFCYWLQGFSELTNEPPSPEQWKSIQEHLKTVFVKVTPPVEKSQAASMADLLKQYGPGVSLTSIVDQPSVMIC